MTGRVIEEHKTSYVVSIDGIEFNAVVRGHFHADETDAPYPKVGDLVDCVKASDDQLVIERIQPRRSEIARKMAGGTTRQVMVANADLILIVMGLDEDFNLRRLERYLMLARQSSVEAVVVLNKSDTVSDVGTYLQRVRDIAPSIPIYAISASTGDGMDTISGLIRGETIAVLLGSSGAGKSTITNSLLRRDQQTTGAVRTDDSRGRHTTTSRQMFALPQGGYLVDTPGMRELGILDEESDGPDVFADIDMLKGQCRYPDCDHEKSDGCAVQRALASGALDADHYKSYLKLLRERDYLHSKVDEAGAHQRKQHVRKLRTGYNKVIKQKHSSRSDADQYS